MTNLMAALVDYVGVHSSRSRLEPASSQIQRSLVLTSLLLIRKMERE